MMASKSCFRLINGDSHLFPVLSECLDFTLSNGTKVTDLVVEEPHLGTYCESAGGLTPPTLDLGHEGRYFRPDTVLSSTSRRSASSKQLQLVPPSEGQDLKGHLLYVCVRGLSDALQLVLSEAPDIDLDSPLNQSGTNDQELTPLSWAALNSNSAVCRLLVSKGAGVDVRDCLGRTALHWAVVGGWTNAVKTLLKLEADPSLADEKGFTLLHYACIFGMQELAVVLLKEDVSLVDLPHEPTGSTALLLASYCGHHNTVKLLLKNRASLHVTNDQGLTPLHCSVWSSDMKCVKAVLGYVGRDTVDARDGLGRTPLHTAALKGDPSLCQGLLKRGAQSALCDSGGRTLLHWAVLSGQPSCVEWVLSLDSTLLNGTDAQGATPLHYAACAPNSNITELLISKGADPALSDAKARPPLVWASSFGREPNVRCLLAEDQLGGAVHAGASVGAVGVCQLLTERDRECVHAVSDDGYSALHYASRFGHAHCVEVLLASGAPVDALSHQQETSLHLACAGGHAQTAHHLLSSGADQTTPLAEHWPVHIAASGGHKDVLEVLINHDQRVMDQPSLSADSHAPLHLAASHGHLDCCRLLVAQGCAKEVTLNNVYRHSALDLAMLGGHMGCADYLISVGVSTGGGAYHRAAATIQAVWRYHRHKRRVRVCREWCAGVIQRAVRGWLRRRAAVRVRQARHRHRNKAARSIQRQWRVFIRLKRRYEASCAQLRTRLHQETLATTLILSQLHLSAQCVSLPPPIPTASHGPSAKHLLKVSSTPAPLFPSDSLLFPAKPRTPLTRRPLPPRAGISRPSPRTRPLLAVRVPQTNISSGDKVRLPPINSLSSQQLQAYQPITSRGPPPQDEPDGGSTTANQNETGRVHSIRNQEMNRGSPTDPDLSSSVDRLPKLPRQTSLVSVSPCEEPTGTAHLKRPFLSLPSQAQLKLTRRSTFKNILLTSAPVVSLPDPDKEEDGQEMLNQPQLPEPSPEPTTESKRDSPSPQDGVEGVGGVEGVDGVEDVMLNNIQRYDKLNQILSLLQQARDGGSKEQEVIKLSQLKEQIMGALDEAVRLRAETEALQHKVRLRAETEALQHKINGQPASNEVTH